MAAGAPIVASRGPVAPELIEDGQNGLLVDPGDRARARVRSLERVLNDEALARRPTPEPEGPSAVRAFDWETIAGLYSDVYETARHHADSRQGRAG